VVKTWEHTKKSTVYYINSYHGPLAKEHHELLTPKHILHVVLPCTSKIKVVGFQLQIFWRLPVGALSPHSVFSTNRPIDSGQQSWSAAEATVVTFKQYHVVCPQEQHADWFLHCCTQLWCQKPDHALLFTQCKHCVHIAVFVAHITMALLYPACAHLRPQSITDNVRELK